MGEGKTGEPVIARNDIQSGTRRGCRRSDGSVRQYSPLRLARRATRRNDECVTFFSWNSGAEVRFALFSDDRTCSETFKQRALRRCWKSSVNRKDGIASFPYSLQRVDEFGAARKVNAGEFTHDDSAQWAEELAVASPLVHDGVNMTSKPSISDWISGARPRTLPASIVPVAVGAAVAVDAEGWPSVNWTNLVLALLVSLLLQVGVNFANDYSDGVRGTDDVRVGPLRLVASGVATPAQVRAAALFALGAAAAAGFGLAVVTSWWLLVVGVAALLAAWGYTGGPRPYGYLGLGEVFVFTFFGLVATVGTTYVVSGSLVWRAYIAGAAVGALACALLVVNNLRDIPTDREVGKRTLAVRIGDRATRRLYVALVVVAFIGAVLLVQVTPLLALVAIVPAYGPVGTVLSGATGRDLIGVLGQTGRVQLIFGGLLTLGLVL